VRPLTAVGALPFGGVSYNPRWHGLSFGFALYSPHIAAASFPKDGAQRYIVTDGSITTLYLSPTVAWRPHRAIAVGAGPSIVRASASYERAMWLPPDVRRLNPDELWAALDGSGWAAAWGAGLLFFPGTLVPWLHGLEVGVSYASRVNLEFDGEVRVRGASAQFGGMMQPGYEEGQTITRSGTARLTLPDMLRIGLGYDFGRRAWVGADLYWTHYRLFDALVIKLDEPLGFIDELREEKHCTNNWSLAAGGRVTPTGPLDLRLGFFFDQSPYPDAYYTTLSPDSRKLGLTSGLSWRLPLGFEVSGAYMVLFYADRQVTNSQIRPDFGGILAPFSASGEVRGKVVHLVALQTSWRR
jgi:long-chain fatty acid transport protein